MAALPRHWPIETKTNTFGVPGISKRNVNRERVLIIGIMNPPVEVDPGAVDISLTLGHAMRTIVAKDNVDGNRNPDNREIDFQLLGFGNGSERVFVSLCGLGSGGSRIAPHANPLK